MTLLLSLEKVLRPLSELSARRPDGDLVTRIHPYRKMLCHMMPGRNESIVYYEDLVRAEAILDYIKRARQQLQMEVDITHCLVASVGIGMFRITKMNQFVSGGRLYARNHVAVTFTMKRKKLDKEAKLSAVKMFFEPDDTFEGVCRRINEQISVERTEARTYTDKELDVLTMLPRPLLRSALAAVRLLDYYNLLPISFIKNDGFYASMVIANLGSLGMAAAYHHLYEYGNCPLFLMVGRVEDRAMVEEGKVVVRKILPLRWSYDERIDDGLTANEGITWVRECMEQPERYFGALPAVKEGRAERRARAG